MGHQCYWILTKTLPGIWLHGVWFFPMLPHFEALNSHWGSVHTYIPSTYLSSTYIPSTYLPSTHIPCTYLPSPYIPFTYLPSPYIPSTYLPSTYIPSTYLPYTYLPYTYLHSFNLPTIYIQIDSNDTKWFGLVFSKSFPHEQNKYQIFFEIWVSSASKLEQILESLFMSLFLSSSFGEIISKWDFEDRTKFVKSKMLKTLKLLEPKLKSFSTISCLIFCSNVSCKWFKPLIVWVDKLWVALSS